MARAASRRDRSVEVTGEQQDGITRLAARSARVSGKKAVASGQWLAVIALEAAGHVPLRDLATLRAHHHDLQGSLLAGSLITAAGRSTALLGAATGALAAASEVTPATWGSLPFELVAETLVVVAIEMKLVGELHEAAGIRLPADLRGKGPLIARAWAESRGFRPEDLVGMVRTPQPGALGGAAAELLGRSARDQLTVQLKRRLMRTTGRSMLSLTPMLIGAAAGAGLNRRATRLLGTKVATSLGIPPP